MIEMPFVETKENLKISERSRCKATAKTGKRYRRLIHGEGFALLLFGSKHDHTKYTREERDHSASKVNLF